MVAFNMFLHLVALWLTSFLPQVVPSRLERTVPTEQFAEFEELARIVDISYCVGAAGAGIDKPFTCASRCSDFKDFELIKTWSTGQLLSDSCGYIALSHNTTKPRIILAFRGTYSIANTIADLSTIPQDYVDYDGDNDDDDDSSPSRLELRGMGASGDTCEDCKVHSGFMRSWRNTKPEVLPDVERLLRQHPSYELVLVGHSLGGAVAALAGLHFKAKGWDVKVTTFGEPRIGNEALAQYLDTTFTKDGGDITSQFRRVTHIDDPIPLLPLTEWGFHAHSGEIFISKSEVPPSVEDLQYCEGAADPNCIARGEMGAEVIQGALANQDLNADYFWDWWDRTKGSLAIPARFKIWQLFLAHRDYFWRLGLCVPWSGLQGGEE